MSDVELKGSFTDGFAAVADTFLENFDRRGDTGAACAVYVGGTAVVDVWAGTTTAGEWEPDTRSCVFSVSKGVLTVCMLMAVEQGLIELDAPVGSYWPEFAVRGKEATTVRHLLAHQAGLPAPDVDLTMSDLQAWEPVVKALAAQTPAWAPGTAFAYHALTMGWLVGEVLRRATGRRPGEWLADHVARPLELAMTFGVDPTAREFCPMLDTLPSTDLVTAEAAAATLEIPMVARAMSLGGVIDIHDFFASANRPEFLACEVPAANLVSNARSLARLYAATVGELDGLQLLAPATVRGARMVRSEGPPFVGLYEGHRWGTGFMLSSPRRPMLGDGSFGHDGAGGHLAFGHLEAQVGFAYQTSRPGGVPDDRADALCRALSSCL